MFKTRSQSNIEIKASLKPDLWFRDRNTLLEKEKHIIRRHLEHHFFDKDTRARDFSWDYYDQEIKKKAIFTTINTINYLYKINNYTPNFLEDKSTISACNDFYNIFSHWEGDIVIETLSIYWLYLIKHRPRYSIYKSEWETTAEFEKKVIENDYINFDKFASELNNVFWDFWINIYLSREWFIPRQEEKIITQIYEPVIKCLSWWNFKEVERDLSDAFNDYRAKDYSWSITKAFSALQAFLQIRVIWAIWKWDFSDLIKEAISKWIIPNDTFTKTIFRNIESIISRERKETWDPHPKVEYATEKSAKVFLNLTMVFLQHCLQT